jgi:hypothetical protein
MMATEGSEMLRGEFMLLVADKMPEAERQVRRGALRGSLTAKIIAGYFGGPKQLFVKRALELAKAVRDGWA